MSGLTCSQTGIKVKMLGLIGRYLTGRQVGRKADRRRERQGINYGVKIASQKSWHAIQLNWRLRQFLCCFIYSIT